VAAYRQPPAATQKGANTLITTNDSRVLNAEWRNNRLVAAQTVGVNSDSQAHARWYEFSTSGATSLTQQGTIGLGSGANSYFPSIAVNPGGDLGMTFYSIIVDRIHVDVRHGPGDRRTRSDHADAGLGQGRSGPLRRIVRQLAVPRRGLQWNHDRSDRRQFLGGERICQTPVDSRGELGHLA